MNNNTLFYILITAAIAAFLVLLIKLYLKLRKPDITKMYRSKPILTDREYSFYEKLRELADEYGLQIFTKVRLADLIEPKDRSDLSLWWECFNKIKAKHIDFALADRDTNIILLIELDDSTHARADRIERDEFVDAVLDNTGYTLMRTYGETEEIEKFLSY
ncbi:MAG: DUF2726 domain-containing protein [Ruminococcus sp.]|nr:DUF2726 domain-containing protein [Ruminococcus sp.]